MSPSVNPSAEVASVPSTIGTDDDMYWERVVAVIPGIVERMERSDCDTIAVGDMYSVLESGA